MPPSPVLHPSWSVKSRERHNRGRSYENKMMFLKKDNDLMLFNDMSARERENFLLPCADEDLDDVITTKLRYFSDFKLGITIPAREDSSDLLQSDEEKNDYDWLLTPPDTPLFPSLDNESIQPSNLSRRGRPRSQPIIISRSNNLEISHNNMANRTSASPGHLSPSSRSSTNTSLSNIRPSSAPNSGIRHPSTPQRRHSMPPHKDGSPARSRNMSTRSSGYGSLSGNGTSPLESNRGTSASPKLRTWQNNLPALPSDVPPNLRTSLADRPVYVRGASPASRSRNVRGSSPASTNGRQRESSPASRNGRERTSTSGRKSASPSISRGTSSPRSHDLFSSCSKGSIGSSCDGEVESVPSMVVDNKVTSPGDAGKLFARRRGPFSSPEGLAYAKRASRPVSSSSAPKCSFDSAMHQVDLHKSPRKMFRPLLSSVPYTSFYIGKPNILRQRFTAFNSTVTSSGSVSSVLGVIIAPDTDVSDHKKDDILCELEKGPFVVDQEVFSSGKTNELNNWSPEMELKDVGFKGSEATCHLTAGNNLIEANTGGNKIVSSVNCSGGYVDKMKSKIDVQDESVSPADNFSKIITCFMCGKEFHAMEILDEYLNTCKSCNTLHCNMQPHPDRACADIHTKDINSETFLSSNKNRQDEPSVVVEDVFKRCTPNPEHGATSHRNIVQSDIIQLARHKEEGASQLSDRELEQHPVNSVELNGGTPMDVPGTVDYMLYKGSPFSDNGSSLPSQDTNGNTYPSLRLEEASEGAGVSLLLAKSPSCKRPVVHGKTLSTLSIPYDSPSYVTNSFNAVGGYSDTSCSSCSTDAASAGQTDSLLRCGTGGQKSDLGSPRISIHSHEQFKPASGGVQIFSFETEVHSAEAVDSKDEDALTAMQEEGTRKADGLKHCSSRNITLEEATDSILFCSSIVHDLAYTAASIAIEKEESLFSEDLLPIAFIPDRIARTDTGCSGMPSSKPVVGSRKPRAKEQTQNINSSTFGQTEMEVFYDTKIHHVPPPQHIESTKPPKLESKCNCSRM